MFSRGGDDAFTPRDDCLQRITQSYLGLFKMLGGVLSSTLLASVNPSGNLHMVSKEEVDREKDSDKRARKAGTDADRDKTCAICQVYFDNSTTDEHFVPSLSDATVDAFHTVEPSSAIASTQQLRNLSSVTKSNFGGCKDCLQRDIRQVQTLRLVERNVYDRLATEAVSLLQLYQSTCPLILFYDRFYDSGNSLDKESQTQKMSGRFALFIVETLSALPMSPTSDEQDPQSEECGAEMVIIAVRTLSKIVLCSDPIMRDSLPKLRCNKVGFAGAWRLDSRTRRCATYLTQKRSLPTATWSDNSRSSFNLRRSGVVLTALHNVRCWALR
jgi:hypothetical protein